MLQVLYTASTEGNTLIMKKKLWIGGEWKENGFKLYLHQQRETEKTTAERQRASSGVETRDIETESVQTTDKQTEKGRVLLFPSTFKIILFFSSSLLCRPQISKQLYYVSSELCALAFLTSHEEYCVQLELQVAVTGNCCVVDSKHVQDQHL
jgi:hypothetical protein